MGNLAGKQGIPRKEATGLTKRLVSGSGTAFPLVGNFRKYTRLTCERWYYRG